MTWLGRMYEEEKQEAVKNAVKNADAKRVVGMVKNASRNLHVSIADACATVGIDMADYDNAVRLVGEPAIA